MLLRNRRLFMVSCALVLATFWPRDAFAILGWIEHMSGPGPFWVVEEPVPFYCVGLKKADVLEIAKSDALRAETQRRVQYRYPGWQAESTDSVTPQMKLFNALLLEEAARLASLSHFRSWNCHKADRNSRYMIFGVDVVGMSTKTNPLIPESRVSGLSLIGYTDVHVNKFVEVGAGMGITRFFGPDFDSFSEPVLQPLRLTFKPFALVNEQHGGLFRIHLSMLVYPHLNGGDFGAPDNPFRSDFEVLWNPTFDVDVLELVNIWRKK